MKPLQIIGCGPGGRATLTLGAIDVANKCKCLMGAPHLLNLFPQYSGSRLECSSRTEETVKLIEIQIKHFAPVGVLVSGDTGLYSLATPLIRHFGSKYCEFHPGISSVQLACARLGLSWEYAQIISAHATLPVDISDTWRTAPLLIVLTGTPAALQWCAWLHLQLEGNYQAFACSDLSMPEERIEQIVNWANLPFRSRTLIVFQREHSL